ncbi:hypothetical protein A2U01_0100059, partial [Trifolium medium]|nr:hypothetical protein [Trifolium medium]
GSSGSATSPGCTTGHVDASLLALD